MCSKALVPRVRFAVESGGWITPGKYFRIENCTVEPKPTQKPRPPIWWPGDSPESQNVVAELCDGWLMGDRSPEGARKSIQGIRNLLGGRALDYALSCHLIVRKSDEAARESLRSLLGENRRSFDEIVHHGLIGAPATMAQKLRGYEEAGIQYILLKPAPTLEGLEAFGEEVLPHLGK